MTDVQILRNLVLLSTSATRQLVEDPVLLACRERVGCLSPGAVGALRHSVSGRMIMRSAEPCQRSSPTDRTQPARR